jgi:hypothetical protein
VRFLHQGHLLVLMPGGGPDVPLVKVCKSTCEDIGPSCDCSLNTCEDPLCENPNCDQSGDFYSWSGCTKDVGTGKWCKTRQCKVVPTYYETSCGCNDSGGDTGTCTLTVGGPTPIEAEADATYTSTVTTTGTVSTNVISSPSPPPASFTTVSTTESNAKKTVEAEITAPPTLSTCFEVDLEIVAVKIVTSDLG